MFILNITFLVSDHIEEKWLNWAKEIHIPFVTSSGQLTDPQLSRIWGESDQEGKSFSIQYKAKNMETLNEWHKQFGDAFSKQCEQTFNQEVLFFSTVLEILG